MKILFVSSGRNSEVSTIVKDQGESLKKAGMDIFYFTIRGRGFTGYFRSIFFLRQEVRKNNPDIIHAHYSLCGIVATLATKKPVVVSLMGSDIVESYLMIFFIKILSTRWWKATIVKSKGMKERISLVNSQVVPNGVDMSAFKPMDRLECKKRTGFDASKKQILFLADPARYAKNFTLAQSASLILEEDSGSMAELKVVHGIDHDQVVLYINAADVVLLTSRWEGSPNIIKESMACNTPIVTTRVGDVEEIIGATKGCFLADPVPEDIAAKLKCALAFEGRTNGRENIQYLDSGLIAQRLISIYKANKA